MTRIAEITETKDGRPCVVLEMAGDEGAVSLYAPEEIEAMLRRQRESFINEIADWMIQHSFATGHGDTLSDLLDELSRQVSDLRALGNVWNMPAGSTLEGFVTAGLKGAGHDVSNRLHVFIRHIAAAWGDRMVQADLKRRHG